MGNFPVRAAFRMRSGARVHPPCSQIALRPLHCWRIRTQGTCAMNLCCRSALLALCFPVALWAQENPPDPRASDLLRHLRDELPAIRDTLRDRDAAPDRSWFGGKGSFQDDIDGYLDEALDLVLPRTYRAARDRLTGIDRLIVEKQKAQAALKLDMTLAPEAAAAPPAEEAGPLDGIGRLFTGEEKGPATREDLAQEIAALEAEIAALRAERQQVIDGFRRTLAESYQLQLDGRQAEALLYQVNGGDLVDAVAVASILTDLEGQLRGILADASATVPEVREQYLGVAVLTRMIIARLQAQHLQHYDDRYLPALDELKAENRRIRQESEKVLAEAGTPDHRAAVEANIRILDQVEGAIDLYRNVLVERRDKTAIALRAAEQDARVAMNTLNTFSVAMNFDAVVTGSIREFAALSELTAPDLLPLDDSQMYQQFLDISRQLPGS